MTNQHEPVFKGPREDVRILMGSMFARDEVWATDIEWPSQITIGSWQLRRKDLYKCVH